MKHLSFQTAYFEGYRRGKKHRHKIQKIKNPRGIGGRPRLPEKPKNWRVKGFTIHNTILTAVIRSWTKDDAINQAKVLWNKVTLRRIGASATKSKPTIRGGVLFNPVKEKKQFMSAIVSDPFYKTLLIKGASRLIALLKEGKFNRREWLSTIESIVERIARENKISLTRMEKLKLALTLARQLWDSYVHRKR